MEIIGHKRPVAFHHKSFFYKHHKKNDPIQQYIPIVTCWYAGHHHKYAQNDYVYYHIQ